MYKKYKLRLHSHGTFEDGSYTYSSFIASTLLMQSNNRRPSCAIIGGDKIHLQAFRS